MPMVILWDLNKFRKINLDNSDENVPLYKQVNLLLGASTLTVHRFTNQLEAYVDDEGLYNQEKIGALWKNKEGKLIQPIKGPIVFTNTDEDGETIDVSEEQIELIKKIKLTLIQDNYIDKIYQVLDIRCDFL